jgi:hypothetical protein
MPHVQKLPSRRTSAEPLPAGRTLFSGCSTSRVPVGELGPLRASLSATPENSCSVVTFLDDKRPSRRRRPLTSLCDNTSAAFRRAAGQDSHVLQPVNSVRWSVMNSCTVVGFLPPICSTSSYCSRRLRSGSQLRSRSLVFCGDRGVPAVAEGQSHDALLANPLGAEHCDPTRLDLVRTSMRALGWAVRGPGCRPWLTASVAAGSENEILCP